MNNNNFIQEAIKQASLASSLEEIPIGAVVVHSASGEVVARAHNLIEKNNDPTAHAELLAIKQACRKVKNIRLNEYDLYSSLEPCPMCAQAIAFARIKRLYFAAYDKKGGGVEHGPHIFESSSCHHKPEIYGGIMENESQELLQSFFKSLRNK